MRCRSTLGGMVAPYEALRPKVFLLVGLAACSSSSGGGGGDVQSVPCGDVDTVMVEGTLDGASVAASSKPTSFAWINVGTPPKFDGAWSGGALHLEWGQTIANGAPTAVTAATLKLDANAKARTFQSGTLVYDSARGSSASTLRTELTFDTGHVTVCVHKK